MRIIKIASIALIVTIAAAACKYEDGKVITTRAKRDRVSNEWTVKELKIKVGDNRDSNLTSLINQPNQGFRPIFTIMRTGHYNVNIVRPVWNGTDTVFEDEVTGFSPYKAYALQWNRQAFDAYTSNLPVPFSYIFPNGKWSFDKGHSKLQLLPDLATINDDVVQQLTRDFTITRLANNELNLKGRTGDNKEWSMKLEPINEEPFWY